MAVPVFRAKPQILAQSRKEEPPKCHVGGVDRQFGALKTYGRRAQIC
jgi:hypothetical protein